MRDIKFRAWIKDDRKLNKGFMVYPDGWKLKFRMVSNGIGFGIVVSGNEWLRDEDYEIMQYTGLKDKNGKEIYEGDIVKWFNRHIKRWYSKEVIYDSDFGCFTVKEDIIDWFDMGEHLEIIGNIHEGVE